MARRRLLPVLDDVRSRPREYAKLGLRNLLYRRHLDLVADPYPARVAATLAHHGLTTVLDVGANIGQYASALRACGYRGAIVSCEPLSDAFAHLRRRAEHDTGWETLNTAVGDRTGTADINVSANSFSSSLLTMTHAHTSAAPGSETVATEPVPLTTVAEIVKERGLDPSRTLLKIDTQGYEAPVLDGAGSLVGELAAISLELSFVALYEGQQLFDDLVARLRESGYVLYAIEGGFGDRRTGRMLQCDGLFVRADLVAQRR
ncbi:MAG TPA: FkbM family methyltransferase [Jatrophihabitans sp.]|nr:FkbM family methyltransferase [Jatrophihabitans sp.]